MGEMKEEEAARVQQQMEELVVKMNLSPMEEVFARELAETIFEHVIGEYQHHEHIEKMRAAAAAAGVAHALIAVDSWARRFDADAPKM
jgi:hypothetical protein